MKVTLVKNATHAWRWLSVQLSVVVGAVVAYLLSNPDETQKLLEFLPDGPLRVVSGIVIGALVTGAATTARVVSVPRLEGD